MFFILSKLFWAVARPLNILFLLALAAWLAARFGWHRPAFFLMPAIAISVALIGFTQLPDFLLLRLENRIADAPLDVEPYGIIVLGGGLGATSALRPDDYHLGEAADRLVKGLELKRRFPAARLIYSGGRSTIDQQGLPEARAAQRMIVALYGDDHGVEFEPNAKNTWENADFTARLAGSDAARPWLLVTSAFHMPRALGCFRQARMNVAPASTDFRADELKFPYLESNMAGQFLKMSIFVKEIVGLAAYRATGKIPALLPG